MVDGWFCEIMYFVQSLEKNKNNDKLICLNGKFTLLLQRQTFKKTAL